MDRVAPLTRHCREDVFASATELKHRTEATDQLQQCSANIRSLCFSLHVTNED